MASMVAPPNKIAEARNAKGWTQEHLGNLIGVSQQAVQRYESRQRELNASTLIRLSLALNVTVAYLLYLTNDTNGEEDHVSYAPLHGDILANTFLDASGADELYPLPGVIRDRWPQAVLLRVKDGSMDHILPQGSLALLDPCTSIEYDGQPYAVCIDDKPAAIRRVRKVDNGLELVPDTTSRAYGSRAFYCTKAHAHHRISVIGRVVWHCIPYDWSY